MNAILQEAFDFSQYTGAWLSLWLGFAFEMDGDDSTASYFYRKAHAVQSNIPRPASPPQSPESPVPPQVVHVSEQMRIGHSNSISIQAPKTIHQDLVPLSGNGSPAQTEEALRCLAQYLGLNSTRPDNEYGTGPDVLWLGDDGFAICMEVKTCKKETPKYRKDNVGQLHNHIQWVNDNHEVSTIVPVFVGPLLPATKEASPSPDMMVVELDQFKDLSEKLVSALQDAAEQAIPLSLANDLHEVIRNRGLLYPEVFLSLEMSSLQDIQPNSPVCTIPT